MSCTAYWKVLSRGKFAARGWILKLGIVETKHTSLDDTSMSMFFMGAFPVYRRGHDVLQDQLPSKGEHVIMVRLSPIQRALYTEFMKRFREAGNSGWLGLNPLKAFCVCCKVRLLFHREIWKKSDYFFVVF